MQWPRCRCENDIPTFDSWGNEPYCGGCGDHFPTIWALVHGRLDETYTKAGKAAVRATLKKGGKWFSYRLKNFRSVWNTEEGIALYLVIAILGILIWQTTLFMRIDAKVTLIAISCAFFLIYIVVAYSGLLIFRLRSRWLIWSRRLYIKLPRRKRGKPTAPPAAADEAEASTAKTPVVS